jgi:hypothetical protein
MLRGAGDKPLGNTSTMVHKEHVAIERIFPKEEGSGKRQGVESCAMPNLMNLYLVVFIPTLKITLFWPDHND